MGFVVVLVEFVVRCGIGCLCLCCVDVVWIVCEDDYVFVCVCLDLVLC